MAGIFNVFGDVSGLDKGQALKPLSRSKTTLGLSGPIGKTAGVSKPKGLSIRSNSDLNVPSAPRLNKFKQDDLSNKQPEFLKPTPMQLDSSKRSVSPVKKFNIQPSKMRMLTPTKKALDTKPQKSPKILQQNVFKKPLTPKKILKKQIYPEPENLAPYCDVESHCDDNYNLAIEKEFRKLIEMRISKVEPYKDEGRELVRLLEVPKLSLSYYSSDENLEQGSSPNLPEISDDCKDF